MRHRVGGRRLSRPTAHRLALYRNLVIDLVEHEKIVTTEAKAKEVRPLAEKLITLGKDGTVQARQQALRFIGNKTTVKKVFGDLAPRYADRNGGYTRIIKLGYRQGDGSSIAQLEMV
jgi:large subunit ribosomal protein L17